MNKINNILTLLHKISEADEGKLLNSLNKTTKSYRDLVSAVKENMKYSKGDSEIDRLLKEMSQNLENIEIIFDKIAFIFKERQEWRK